MYIGFIAKRYATALADFAAINNEEERVFDEVKRFIAIFDENRYARSILLSPVQPIAEKENAVQKLLDNNTSSSFNGFIKLVLRHGREKYLNFILHSYIYLYRERHKILNVSLTTAVPFSDNEIKQKIAEILPKELESYRLELHNNVDSSIIGGFIFKFNDTIVDASLSGQLKQLEKRFGIKQNRIL